MILFLKKNRITLIATALLIVAASVLGLHGYSFWANWSYPRSDDADFFDISHQIWYTFKKDGFLAYLQDLYSVRAWKPIILPSLSSLYLLLTDGQVIASLRWTNFTLLLLTGFNIYRLSNLLFKEKVISVAVTFCLVSLPFMFAIFDTYTAEVILIASVTGYFYSYIIKIQNPHQSSIPLIFWLAFGLLARPAEMLMITAATILHEAYKAFREQKIKTLTGLLFLIATLSLFILSYAQQKYGFAMQIENYFYFLMAAQVVFVAVLRNKINLFLKVGISVNLIFTLWYYPYAVKLVHWLYVSSVGIDAKVTGGRFGNSVSEFLLKIFSYVGGQQLYILAAAAFVLILMTLLKLKNQKNINLPEVDFGIKVLLVSLPVPFAVSAFGENADMRYHCGNIVLLFLVLFYFCHLFLKKKFIFVFFSLLFCLQTLNITSQLHYLNIWKPFWARSDIAKRISFRSPSYLKVDPITSFANQLMQELKEYKDRPLKIASLNTNWDTDSVWTLDRWAISICFREAGYDQWSVLRPTVHTLKPEDDKYAAVKADHDYLIVGPISLNDLSRVSRSDFLAPVTIQIINWKEQGLLAEKGLQFVSEFAIEGRDGSRDHAWLLKVLKP